MAPSGSSARSSPFYARPARRFQRRKKAIDAVQTAHGSGIGDKLNSGAGAFRQKRTRLSLPEIAEPRLKRWSRPSAARRGALPTCSRKRNCARLGADPVTAQANVSEGLPRRGVLRKDKVNDVNRRTGSAFLSMNPRARDSGCRCGVGLESNDVCTLPAKTALFVEVASLSLSASSASGSLSLYHCCTWQTRSMTSCGIGGRPPSGPAVGQRGTISATSRAQGTTAFISPRNFSRRVRCFLPASSSEAKVVRLIEGGSRKIAADLSDHDRKPRLSRGCLQCASGADNPLG